MVIAELFIPQVLPEKKMYMIIVMAKAAKYIEKVEPTRTHLQTDELAFVSSSALSKHISTQVCARSTNKTRPSRVKSIPPAKAMYLP